jgi:peptide deformylase
MALRQIRQLGDEILQKKARPVTEVNDNTRALLDDMLETLRDKDGVGIAAPQVGVLRRVAVVEHEDVLYEMVNPRITESKGVQRCDEACLSVPGKQGEIDRPRKITVEAFNRQGSPYTFKADDFLASVICHELDHLDGVLYIDKAVSIKNRERDKSK